LSYRCFLLKADDDLMGKFLHMNPENQYMKPHTDDKRQVVNSTDPAPFSSDSGDFPQMGIYAARTPAGISERKPVCFAGLITLVWSVTN